MIDAHRNEQTPSKVCLIGLGDHGMREAVRLGAEPTKWNIVSVADTSKVAYASFQYRFYDRRIPFYNDSIEAIQADDIDVVIVATTAPAHVPITRNLISNGYQKAILVEKPIATSVAEGRQLASWIAERGWRGKIAIDFNRRCSRLYRHVFELICAGAMGPLVRIAYNRRGKISMKGSHYFDLVNWFVQAKPISVSAQLGYESTVDHRGVFFFDPPGFVEVCYTNGVTASFDMIAEESSSVKGMTLTFEQGTIFVNAEESLALVKCAAESIE